MTKIKITVREGYKLNPNEQEVNGILNTIGHKNGHCMTYIKDRIGSDLCPCSNYLSGGKCFCGLYIKQQ